MKKLWSILTMSAMCLALTASIAFAADDAAGAIDTGDTAWVLISAALVFLMTPGLAFFYGGMVRSKNVLSTIMHSFFIVAMISVEWVILGYAMTFGSDIGGFIGSLDKIGLAGVGLQVMEGGTIPELAFVAFQCMFAVITQHLSQVHLLNVLNSAHLFYSYYYGQSSFTTQWLTGYGGGGS